MHAGPVRAGHASLLWRALKQVLLQLPVHAFRDVRGHGQPHTDFGRLVRLRTRVQFAGLVHAGQVEAADLGFALWEGVRRRHRDDSGHRPPEPLAAVFLRHGRGVEQVPDAVEDQRVRVVLVLDQDQLRQDCFQVVRFNHCCTLCSYLFIQL